MYVTCNVYESPSYVKKFSEIVFYSSGEISNRSTVRVSTKFWFKFWLKKLRRSLKKDSTDKIPELNSSRATILASLSSDLLSGSLLSQPEISGNIFHYAPINDRFVNHKTHSDSTHVNAYKAVFFQVTARRTINR